MKVLIVNGYGNNEAGKEAFKKFVVIAKKVIQLTHLIGV